MSFDKDMSHTNWENVRKKQTETLSLAQKWIQITGMTTGSIVMDIGPGAGVLTAEYAKAVGKEGKVYAVEQSSEALEYMREQTVGDLPQVELVNMDAQVVLPQVDNLHSILITSVLHHTDSPLAVLRHVREVANSRTQVLISEFDPEEKGGFGMPLEHRLSRQQLIQWSSQAGFQLMDSQSTDYEQYWLLLRAI